MAGLSCSVCGFWISPLFAPQRSTQSRGTLMAAPATCPSCMTASGSTTALISGARTVTSGVQQPTTTARTSDGASVLWRVSYIQDCSLFTVISSHFKPWSHSLYVLPSLTGNGCETFWDTDPLTDSCYQFNFQATLSWSEARISCQQQGADLLSITKLHEQTYINGKGAQEHICLVVILHAHDEYSAP